MNEKYMRQAIRLALQGVGKVNPNPLVGAVIVCNDTVIATGYHQQYGGPHAEVNAIKSCNQDLSDATIYVTLEPCSHIGKTPACAQLIIDSKIKRVVIGAIDPNPLVAGNGIKMLEDAGIEVICGVLEKQCREMNNIFNKYITTRQPYCLLKMAMSLDGKTATTSGESKWISNSSSRNQVQHLRNQYQAVMVGIGTVLADNPNLTARIENGCNPIRVIVDSKLRIPLDCNLVKTAKDIKTIVATTELAEDDKIKELTNYGVNIIVCDQINNQVDLNDLMTRLGQLEIDSVLIEGGATLNYSALNSGIIDQVKIFIAPFIIGGKEATPVIGGTGIEHLADKFNIHNMTLEKLEGDIVIDGYLQEVKCSQE